uniref:SH3 domain-containing protein n=1 Tax=Timema shepardi TaxID=629360 RepID=A0A7R9BAB7_TIMSH|nr:unnamed protein product [Timema shepardi]
MHECLYLCCSHDYKTTYKPWIHVSFVTAHRRCPYTLLLSNCVLKGGCDQCVSCRRVRTLYACMGENDGELSFEPNQIITNGESRDTNVRPSKEPGWLEGTLNGKTGLVPENYVEFLP